MKVLLILLAIVFTGCQSCREDEECSARMSGFAAALKGFSNRGNTINCTSTQDYFGTVRTNCN